MEKITSTSSASSSGPDTISSAKGSSHNVHIHDDDRASLASHSSQRKGAITKGAIPPPIETGLEAQLARFASLAAEDQNPSWSDHLEHSPVQEIDIPTSMSRGLSLASPPHSTPHAIAPFSHPVPTPQLQSSSDSASTREGISTQDAPPQAGRFGKDRKIPMYGPERIVLDKRIAAVHQQVLVEMLWIGLVWGIVFTAGLLAIPGRRW